MPGKPAEGLAVLLGGRRVGTLAEMPDGLVAFQYDAEWRLAPAYDLTYSAGFHRGHMTSVLGAGEPAMEDVLALAGEVGLPARESKRTAYAIRDACSDLLASNRI